MISRERWGAGPATDNVMETVVEKSEISTLVHAPWVQDLKMGR